MPVRSFGKTIALCVLVAGTLDILDALVFFGLRGIQPHRILQSIASGLLGPAAFSGGLAAALLGLAIHYCITCAWATLFVLAPRRFMILRRRAVVSGLLYGVLIYAVMNYVVLPLTRQPGRPSAAIPVIVNGVAALMLFMGLPIALINRRFQPGTS